MKNSKTPSNGKKRVSPSQFSTFWKCRHKFYLDRVLGLREFEDSVNTCFGTAVHETIQLYLKTLYEKSSKEAGDLDLHEIFKTNFDKELKDKKVEVTPEIYKEFCEDGDNIIITFTNFSNRIKHFPSNKYELIGIEDEIILPIKHNIEFIGYLDLILKEKSTGHYRIVDIKTSTNGWNSYKKSDDGTVNQILLYKAFFSKKYNVDIDMIDVEFFILRRKLWENYSFPQSRIQVFSPKNNQRAVAVALTQFGEFINECFTTDGKFIEDEKIYTKNPGERYKNCKYCPHRNVNCFPTKKDIIVD